MGNLFSKKENESSKETQHHSASYSKESSVVDKVEPIVDDQQPSQPAVQIGPSEQAVCKLIGTSRERVVPLILFANFGR